MGAKGHTDSGNDIEKADRRKTEYPETGEKPAWKDAFGDQAEEEEEL